MNKQEYFDYNMAPIGSIIQNNEKHYQVIGHGIGIAKDKKEDELPLSEIDKKILQYINECGDQLLSQIHEEYAFTEDAPHLCDNTCTTLDIDISNYIDEVLSKIDVFSGHADQLGLLSFIKNQQIDKLNKVFLTHGEEESMLEFRHEIQKIGFKEVILPAKNETYLL